jgi:hypothetical protein
MDSPICLCLKCKRIYDANLLAGTKSSYYKECPDITCGHKAFRIDENMIPIILELNNKGYETEFCCSGHHYEQPDLYIKFGEGVIDVITKGIIEGYIHELPEPFIISGNSIRADSIRVDDYSHDITDIAKTMDTINTLNTQIQDFHKWINIHLPVRQVI